MSSPPTSLIPGRTRGRDDDPPLPGRRQGHVSQLARLWLTSVSGYKSRPPARLQKRLTAAWRNYDAIRRHVEWFIVRPTPPLPPSLSSRTPTLSSGIELMVVAKHRVRSRARKVRRAPSSAPSPSAYAYALASLGRTRTSAEHACRRIAGTAVLGLPDPET